MEKQTFSYFDQAYEELFDNVVRPRKNLHALISHLYPPSYIQVMEAFANYRPLDYKPTIHNSLAQNFVNMDIGCSSSNQKPSTWDEAATSSFSGASG